MFPGGVSWGLAASNHGIRRVATSPVNRLRVDSIANDAVTIIKSLACLEHKQANGDNLHVRILQCFTFLRSSKQDLARNLCKIVSPQNGLSSVILFRSSLEPCGLAQTCSSTVKSLPKLTRTLGFRGLGSRLLRLGASDLESVRSALRGSRSDLRNNHSGLRVTGSGSLYESGHRAFRSDLRKILLGLRVTGSRSPYDRLFGSPVRVFGIPSRAFG